jgi:hypothetical protein
MKAIKANVYRYNNAVRRKLNNECVSLRWEKDGSYCLEVLTYDNMATPDSGSMDEDKRHVTQLSALTMNKETLQAFVLNAVELLNIVEVTGGKPLSNYCADLTDSAANSASVAKEAWTVF